jgi:pSer/pThr/pTyr-binding forkhead associated (FHA) protein
MFRLEIVDDLGRTLNFPLKKRGIVTVGRKRDNDIFLNDKSVSRNHCLLYVSPDAVEVEDLQSANGVLVRGRRISERTKLEPNDEIIIGENRFFLRWSVAEMTTQKTSLARAADLPKKN